MNKLNCLLEDFCCALADLYEIDYPIMDIHKVAKQMDIAIIFDCTASSLDDVTVLKNASHKPEIRLSFDLSKHMESRQIAEGIFIAILSMGYLVEDEKWKYQSNRFKHIPSQEDKKIAEYSALAFLLPKEMFVSISNQYRVGDYYQTSRIAEYFHVSSQMIYERGVSLGMFAQF